MTDTDMPALASFIARGLSPDEDPAAVGCEVTDWRKQFTEVHFIAEPGSAPHGRLARAVSEDGD